MKRLEVVIEPRALDLFREVAPQLGIAEFDVTQVYHSVSPDSAQHRLYRGSQYAVELLPRLKVDFILFDDKTQPTLNKLIELLHPDRVAIAKVDQAIRPAIGQIAATRVIRHERAAHDSVQTLANEAAATAVSSAAPCLKTRIDRLGLSFLRLRFLHH